MADSIFDHVLGSFHFYVPIYNIFALPGNIQNTWAKLNFQSKNKNIFEILLRQFKLLPSNI